MRTIFPTSFEHLEQSFSHKKSSLKRFPYLWKPVALLSTSKWNYTQVNIITAIMILILVLFQNGFKTACLLSDFVSMYHDLALSTSARFQNWKVILYAGLSIGAVTHNTCYSWVCLMVPSCYGELNYSWNQSHTQCKYTTLNLRIQWACHTWFILFGNTQGMVEGKQFHQATQNGTQTASVFTCQSKAHISKSSTCISALQAATILVAMVSGKNIWRLKFWWKSPIGDLQI